MISADAAKEIEERLADLLQVGVQDLRDYLQGRIGAGGGRRTGYRLVRGTHGGQYVRDPAGTDLLPAGVSVPGERRAPDVATAPARGRSSPARR